MIISDYINYDRAVEEILTDKANKETAEINLRMRLEELNQKMSGASAVDTQKEFVDGGKFSDKTLNLIIEKQETMEKLNDVCNFNEAFNIAWEKLDDDEKLMLREFYQSGYTRKQDAIDVLCDALHCERSTLYTKKSKALRKFKKLLIG